MCQYLQSVPTVSTYSQYLQQLPVLILCSLPQLVREQQDRSRLMGLGVSVKAGMMHGRSPMKLWSSWESDGSPRGSNQVGLGVSFKTHISFFHSFKTILTYFTGMSVRSLSTSTWALLRFSQWWNEDVSQTVSSSWAWGLLLGTYGCSRIQFSLVLRQWFLLIFLCQPSARGCFSKHRPSAFFATWSSPFWKLEPLEQKNFTSKSLPHFLFPPKEPKHLILKKFYF